MFYAYLVLIFRVEMPAYDFDKFAMDGFALSWIRLRLSCQLDIYHR